MIKVLVADDEEIVRTSLVDMIPWQELGMVLVGWGSVLLGGCPLRQLILAGSGQSDSAVAVLGMVVGAAFCHNFSLASSTSGPTLNGKIAVVIGLVVCVVIGLLNRQKAE